jgi:hypothetical protein
VAFNSPTPEDHCYKTEIPKRVAPIRNFHP